MKVNLICFKFAEYSKLWLLTISNIIRLWEEKINFKDCFYYFSNTILCQTIDKNIMCYSCDIVIFYSCENIQDSVTYIEHFM